MSTSCRPPVDVIKISLPFPGKNDSIGSLQHAKPQTTNVHAKNILQLASPTVSTATTMAASKLVSMSSPSPKKANANANRSSISSQCSPTSTADFTRAGTLAFSRNPTIAAELNVIPNAKEASMISALNMSVQSPQKTLKSPKGTSSKVKFQEPEAQGEPEGELTEAEINDRLYKVFQFYASFGERCNVGYLKSHRFSKMMVDAELRDDLLPQSSLDLLYAGELRKAGNLDFDHFLSLLKRVARAKFDGQDQDNQEAYNLVLKDYMFPLFEKIFKDDKFFEDESKAASETLEVSTSMALKLVDDTLEQIFRTYFGWELQTGPDPQVLRQRLENSLFIFLREFQLCPGLISKGAAYALYANIMREELPEEPKISPNSSQNLGVAEKQTRSNKKKEQERERDRALPFNYDRFKLFLVRIANMAFSAPVGPDGEVIVSRHPQMDRALQLLERMDIAYRTLNTEKRSALGLGGAKSSLLVSQDAIDKIVNFLKSKEKVVIVRKNSTVVVAPGKRGVLITSGTRYEDYNIEDEDVIEVMEKHNHALKKIFQHYCAYGEPMNNTRLHSFKFIKLIREAGLLQASFYSEGSYKILQGLPQATDSLTTADADIIIARLTGPKQTREINDKRFHHDTKVQSPWLGFLSHLYQSSRLNLSVQNRLEFETFLKAVEMIAAKILPNAKTLGKAVTQVLVRNILKLEAEVDEHLRSVGSEPLKLLVDILQNVGMVDFLNDVHKTMMVYYKYYSDSQGMMNIEKFIQFCKDFGVFPDIVTKGRLCTFFNALAGVRCQAEESEALNLNESTRTRKLKPIEQPEDDLIDQHMFIEALVLIAMETPYLDPQPSDMQKVSNFLEKLNKSEGPLTVRLKMGVSRHNNGPAWDILGEIRIKYPELFLLPEDLVDEEEKEALLEESLRKTK